MRSPRKGVRHCLWWFLPLAVVVAAGCGGGGDLASRAVADGELRDVVKADYVASETADVFGTLDVYAPAAEGPWPVVVAIHASTGPGLFQGWVEAVARRGAVVFVPEWPTYPFIVPGDAKTLQADANVVTSRLACAVRFARTHGERFGGDPSRLTVFGHSAGANMASVIAFADRPPLKGCVAGEGTVVPDNLVLFEGDWLLTSEGAWEGALREDTRVMEALTPWPFLEEEAVAPVSVAILDTNSALCARLTTNMGDWFALRDPTGRIYRELNEAGALEDGTLCLSETQRVLDDRLQSLGYESTFTSLPDSSHTGLSVVGLEMLIDAILERTD